MSAADMQARLDDFGRRLQALEHELGELRAVARPERAPAAVFPPPRPLPAPRRREAATPKPPKRRRELPQLDAGVLFGARGLAWSGGLVTILGVVFFFVLAVDRGWVGPLARVSLGAIASGLVFGGGLWLHRRLSALSSVTRALSFLAVGAVLLLGGFLYQRLARDDDGGPLPAH